jgi:hypothetical protein
VTAALAKDDAALSAALANDDEPQGGALAATMRGLADAEDASAASAAAMHPSDAAFAAEVADYAGATRALAVAARGLAKAAADGDQAEAASDKVATDAVAAQDALRARCATPTPDCAAIDAARAPVVGAAFQGAGRAEQIDALDRAARAVAGLSPKDAALAGASRAYGAALAAWADDLRREDGVVSALGDAQRRFATAARARGPVEERLRAACAR